MKDKTPLKFYPVRLFSCATGEITFQKLTTEQITTGFEGYEMNLEDVGAALLSDLREARGLPAVKVSKQSEAEEIKEIEDLLGSFLQSEEEKLEKARRVVH